MKTSECTIFRELRETMQIYDDIWWTAGTRNQRRPLKKVLADWGQNRPTNDLSSSTLHTTVTSQHLSRKLSSAKWMSLFTWLIMSALNPKPKHQFTGFRIRKLAQHRTGLFLFLGARRILEIQTWLPFVADMPYSYVFCLPLMHYAK